MTVASSSYGTSYGDGDGDGAGGSASSSSKAQLARDTGSETSLQPQPQRQSQTQTRRRPRRDDFWSREYWEERFSLQPPADDQQGEGSSSAQVQDRSSGRDGVRDGGEAFEWLGAGEELLTRLLEGLERAVQGQEEEGRGVEGGPLVLHIGCGSSDVGCRMRTLWEERARTCTSRQGRWALDRIVNLDYAPSSLALTRQQEMQRFGDLKMQHVVADLLSLPSLLAVLPLPPASSGGLRQRDRRRLVDGIYDKSTADAISTGPDVVLLPVGVQQEGGGAISRCSFLNGWTVKAPEDDDQDDLNTSRRARPLKSKKTRDPNEVVVEPVEMLAYNLAAVTRPGAIWAALSYSATRFDFLEKGEKQQQQQQQQQQQLLPDLHADGKVKPIPLTSLWQVEDKWSVEAPGEGQAKKDVHAPEVRHWCFLLRRTEVTLSSLTASTE